MKTDNSKKRLLLTLSPYILFFLISFTYFGVFADYLFFYQEKSSIFLISFDFLKENLNQPGGLLIYTGKFFTSFFYFPVIGAFIVSAVICLTVYLTSSIIRYAKGSYPDLFSFLIGIILFYLQTDYQYQLFNNLGLLLQLFAFYLAMRYLKEWLAIVIAPLLYFVSGGFAFVYCIMMTIHFILKNEKQSWIKFSTLWALSLIVFYISKEYLFYQSVKTLLLFPFVAGAKKIDEALFISGMIIIAALPLLAKIKTGLRLIKNDRVRTIVPLILVAGILVVIAFQRYDIKTKKYFHVEKLFFNNKPEDVIAYNLADPSNNLLTNFLNNIALCETDRLNDLLFHFPQSGDGRTLFLKWEMIGEILRQGGYFYYTLGMINEAHRWAYENMVMNGITPEGLRMMVKTELINGNYAMATKYISLLKNTIFYKKAAGRYEKFLFRNDLVDSDSELGAKRKISIKSDFFVVTGDPLINIERILATDSLNKKAFDYKMAFLLLKKDYAGIAKEAPHIARFYKSGIPVHIEESLVVFNELKNSGLKIPENLKISLSTELSFRLYLETFQKYNNNLKLAEPELKRQFGKTFWYYAFYK